MKIFGWEIKRKESDESVKSVVTPENEESAIDISSYGSFANPYAYTMDFDKKIFGNMNENQLIQKYREISYIPLIDKAIEEIVTDMIIMDGENDPININLDDVKMSDQVKKEIRLAFEHTLNLLHFNQKGHDIARRWYVDGRLNYNLVIDMDKPKKGVQELRYIDPKKIKKIREFQSDSPAQEIVLSSKDIKKFYLYSPLGIDNAQSNNMVFRLPYDTVTYVSSGLIDNDSGATLSWLHKALRPANILRMVEDSAVIYRLNNSAERRIFYIEVGELPTGKAQSYLESIANKYKNKTTYDVTTGAIRDDRKHLAITEDFWIPRRSGQDGTQIDTLPAGCLSMDTKVSLLDGRELSIAEIETEMKNGNVLWTYSCDPITGKIVPGLISWAGVTQESARVMRLTLDNGETITCTPDHKFPVRGRGFVRADELCENESMIPLYRQKKEIGEYRTPDYEMVFDNETKDWVYTHRMVCDYLKDKEVPYVVYNENYSNGKYEVRHHIDFDRFNNSPENLQFMSWADHRKLHNDFGFTKEAQAKGCESARQKLIWLKENNPEEYQRRCDEISERNRIRWASLSKEEREETTSRMSDSAREYFNSLTDEERTSRGETSKENFKNGTEKVQHLLENDEDWREWYMERKISGYTPEVREAMSERQTSRNRKEWDNPDSEIRKVHEKQKYRFDEQMMIECANLVKGKTTHQVTIQDVCDSLNENLVLRQKFVDMNSNRSIPNFVPERGFTINAIRKMVVQNGYESWADFRRKESIFNHQVVKIEYLDDPIQVGTLTIDVEEKYHNYHTFALSAGIFTKNSNLGEMDDVEYFKQALYDALNVPKSRFAEDSLISRGTEISRDEMKFTQFISRLRSNFNKLFLDIMRKHLILKGVLGLEDWKKIELSIKFQYQRDNYFSEALENQIIQERMSVLRDVKEHEGTLFTRRWIQRNILRMTDEDIEEMKKGIEEEKKQGLYDTEDGDSKF